MMDEDVFRVDKKSIIKQIRTISIIDSIEEKSIKILISLFTKKNKL